MHRVAAAALALVAAMITSLAGPGEATSATSSSSSSDPLCTSVNLTDHPRAAHRLRIGVDPGAAGNPVPAGSAPKPRSSAKELAGLRGLHPHGHVLVVRLNRLFWSGGNKLLATFAHRARYYAHHGFHVEVQVRYHPTSAENGHIHAWALWVRHVTHTLGRNPALVSLTITNEVNFAASPNTSDGSYDRAKDALIRGVEAAYDDLHRHHWQHRVRVGFTFAYRFNPSSDAALFSYLGTHGGARFRHALGFVGVDDYPGTFYPPALSPGDTPGHELALALATMRTCYLPKAGIGRSTPLWVTENGFGSNAPQHTDAAQARALRSMTSATVKYAKSYHVTDYRWFNLRDNDSAGSGTFDQDGLLRDDYTHKPSYADLRRFISRRGSR